MEAIGIMGGTFDPVHRGHIACAGRVADMLGLQRVLFIPTGNPNFKQDAHVSPADMRVEMLRAALAEAGDARFALDTREVVRPGVTYSVDTLEELAREMGGCRPFFIMGADAAATLPHWKDAARIAELCRIAVVARPGCDFAALRSALGACTPPFTIEYVEADMPDVSSTQVRARVAAGLPVKELVGAGIAACIEARGLYKDGAREPAARNACGAGENMRAVAGPGGGIRHRKRRGGRGKMTREYDELYARCEKAVDARLSGKRLAHVHSVADYAAYLAQVYGVDGGKARLAGILHDWDKLLVDGEFPARYAELGMELPERYELMWPVLHSFTGAVAVKREFPELPGDVVQAISRHTLGGADMEPLDMVVFVADLIEPLRNAEKRHGVKELREMVGKAPLEELYFEAYVEVMHALIARRRFIHPKAFEIWNELVARYADHSRQKENQGNPDIVL